MRKAAYYEWRRPFYILMKHIFQPATEASAPTLLLLHGTGGDERDLISLGNSLSPGSALLSPRGEVLEQGAPRFFRRFAEGVFDLDDVRRRTADLGDFIVESSARYEIDPSKLIAVGFSNGANIAVCLFLLRPETLGGGILLRSMVVLDQPAATGSLVGKRILLSNGSRDPIVSADQSERLASLLRSGGAQVTVKTQPAGHGLVQSDIGAAQAWLSSKPLHSG